MFPAFGRLCHSPIPRRAAVTLVALAWSSLAFGDPIHDAVRDGDLPTVTALLKGKPTLAFSKDNDGRTLLHWAAFFGHKDVAELLLANKADVDAGDRDGTTPLHWAAMRGHKDVAELLLANKADVNVRTMVDGDTPLNLAAVFGQEDVAELLLANKADVNAEDRRGRTPLYWAEFRGHKDLAELLRQHGGQNRSPAYAARGRGAAPPLPSRFMPAQQSPARL